MDALREQLSRDLAALRRAWFNLAEEVRRAESVGDLVGLPPLAVRLRTEGRSAESLRREFGDAAGCY